MSQRLDTLKARLAALERFKADELALPTPSDSYIADLNDSIKAVKQSIAYVNKNGEPEIQVMNGGGFI